MINENSFTVSPPDFKSFIAKILRGEDPEDGYLQELNSILEDKKLLPQIIKFLDEGACKGELEGHKSKTSLLYSLIARKKYKSIILRLLFIEFNVNRGVISVENIDPDYIAQSPLMLAVRFDDKDIVTAILKHEPDLELKTKSNLNVLHFVSSVAVFNLIHQAVPDQSILHRMLASLDDKGRSPVEHFCDLGLVEPLQIIFQSPEVFHYLNIHSLRVALRTASLKFPQQFQIFNQFCNDLKEFEQEKPFRVENVLIDESGFDMKLYEAQSIERKLIQKNLIAEEHLRTKDQAIFLFIVQLRNLMNTPVLCIPYLKFLNQEFLRYFAIKYPSSSFPILPPSQYEIESVLGYQYPFPKEEFQGIKKNSTLQEFLLSLFVDAGLANIAYKGIGDLPSSLNAEMKSSGAFLLEPRFPSHLNRMKLAHPIQMSILIYAHQANYFTLAYQNESQSLLLDLNEILAALSSEPAIRFLDDEESGLGFSQKSAWDLVFNCFDQYLPCFSDPLRLPTMIILNAESWQIRALADYLIDQYCKKIIRFVSVINQLIIPEQFSKGAVLENIKEGLLSHPVVNKQKMDTWFEKWSSRSVIIEDFRTEPSPYLRSQRNYPRNRFFQPQKFPIPSNAAIHSELANNFSSLG